MASRHKLGTWSNYRPESRTIWGWPRADSDRPVHLSCMDTTKTGRDDVHAIGAIEDVVSTSELATYLQVSLQTVYDLRSQGRGPRGFRVGRELRFRLTEVHAWLERLEEADGARHRSAEPGS